MKKGVIVVFGITGDLAARKLIPALFALSKKPQFAYFSFLGVGLPPVSSDVICNVVHANDACSQEKDSFCARFTLLEGDLLSDDVYADACSLLSKKSGDILFYCATAPWLFPVITKHLVDVSLLGENAPREGRRRIIFEKPFGEDAASARASYELIANYLSEEDFFCIDHYLGKPMTQHIPAFLERLSQAGVESNSQSIEQVQISIVEPHLVGARAAYYDRHGALDDMIQNHVLQLFALFATGHEKVSPSAQSKSKRDVLDACRVLRCKRGQYAGYREEEGVASESETETFAALLLAAKTPQWNGTLFNLASGKALDQYRASISVVPRSDTTKRYVWQIEPSPRFQVWVGDECITNELIAVDSCGPYEHLLEAALFDERELFVTYGEIMAGWEVVRQARELSPTLFTYKKGWNIYEEE
jgi:glucose-6-phosphate 1-dehydrogenase